MQINLSLSVYDRPCVNKRLHTRRKTKAKYSSKLIIIINYYYLLRKLYKYHVLMSCLL